MHATTHKGYKGAGMEGFVARWYTRTRRNEIEDFRRQAEAVAARLRPGSDVLEVAPGPGFFAIELAKLGNFQITGLDISRTFTNIASENAQNAGVKIDFRFRKRFRDAVCRCIIRFCLLRRSLQEFLRACRSPERNAPRSSSWRGSRDPGPSQGRLSR